MPKQTTNSLLEARESTYKGAWAFTGRAIAAIPGAFHYLSVMPPEMVYSWIAILCKLVRALVTPTNLDHWKDIEGYSQLVISFLEDKNVRP